MKLFKLSLLLGLSFLMHFSASAQKIRMKKGDFTALKDATRMKVVFHYENMGVGKTTEEKYVAEKIEEKNADEAGSGDAWHAQWIADRDKYFEPKFMELLKKGLMETKLKVSETYDDASHVLHVHTTHTEPGWNIGIMKQYAFISFELELMEAGSDNVLALMEMDDVRGTDAMGFDFDVAKRLKEGYAKGGKEFARYLTKNELKVPKSSKKKKKKRG